MGLYNSIFVECPNCGEGVEFQTKSGSCEMKSYDIRNVPAIEFEGIKGNVQYCDKCGEKVEILDPENRGEDFSRFVERGLI